MRRRQMATGLAASGALVMMLALPSMAVFAKSGPAPVHLVVWVPDSATQNGTFDMAVRQFNQKYAAQHLSASVQFFTWTDYPEKLTVAMASGVGPDILFNGAAATAGLVTAKEVIPLNSFLPSDPQVKNILKGYEKQTMYRGKSWFVPVEAGVQVLGYRKDFFKKAHLALPRTWAQLLSDAVKLTIPNKRVGIALPTSGIAFQQGISAFLYDNNGDYTNAAGTRATMNTLAARQSLTIYQKFFTKGADNIKFTVPSGQDALGTGQAAMEFNPSLTTIKKYDPKVYNQIGFMPMPPGPLNHTGKGVAYAAANGFYISADAKHPKAAWLLLEQYLKDTGPISEVSGASPVLKADQHAAWIEKNPELRAMYQTMASMRLQGNPNIPQWVTSVRGTVYTDAQAILYGHSVASVLPGLNAAIQADLSTTK